MFESPPCPTFWMPVEAAEERNARLKVLRTICDRLEARLA
jgi:hypothetical protein